jgi:hypothetical protein
MNDTSLTPLDSLQTAQDFLHEIDRCWICQHEITDILGTSRSKSGRLAHGFCLLAAHLTGQPPIILGEKAK